MGVTEAQVVQRGSGGGAKIGPYEGAAANEEDKGEKAGKQDLDAVVGHGNGGLVLARPPPPYLALQLVLELLHGGALAVHQHDVVRQHGADEAAGVDKGVR